MRQNGYVKLIWVVVLVHLGCHSRQVVSFKPKKVYRSPQLVVKQITPNTFVHTSFLQTTDFGYVPCNGLIVRNGNETVVFDTPTNDSATKELINWVTLNLGCKINAIIPTHFHNDCLGGLKAFHAQGVPSYAYDSTITLAKKNNEAVPQYGFHDSLVLNIGNEVVVAAFVGEGHTKDNIVGYFPKEKVLFGGCLIKELGANKGYLGDANMNAWSGTVERVKMRYPSTKVVVPGHGAYGDTALLNYTINLFNPH